MNNRASLFLSLVLRRCPDDEPGPLPPNPDVESVGSQMGKRLDTLSRRTRAELLHKSTSRIRCAAATLALSAIQWWSGSCGNRP
jgi:hypothetical protein